MKLKNKIALGLAGLTLIAGAYLNAHIPKTYADTAFNNIQAITKVYDYYDLVLSRNSGETLDSVFQKANLNPDKWTRVYVGEGEFASDNTLVNRYAPLEIIGISSNSILSPHRIQTGDYLGINNIKFIGEYSASNLPALIGIYRGGYVENCRFDKFSLSVSPSYPLEIINNDFTDVNFPLWAQHLDVELGNGLLVLRKNLFQRNDTSIAINYPIEFNGGLQDEDIGENSFIDCNTIVWNRMTNTQDVYLEGNYIADTIPTAKSTTNSFQCPEYYVYQDEQEVLEKKIINEGTGNVYVHGLLAENPRGECEDNPYTLFEGCGRGNELALLLPLGYALKRKRKILKDL